MMHSSSSKRRVEKAKSFLPSVSNLTTLPQQLFLQRSAHNGLQGSPATKPIPEAPRPPHHSQHQAPKSSPYWPQARCIDSWQACCQMKILRTEGDFNTTEVFYSLTPVAYPRANWTQCSVWYFMQSRCRTASSHSVPGLARQRRCAQRDTCYGLRSSTKLQQTSSNSTSWGMGPDRSFSRVPSACCSCRDWS